MPLTYGEAKKYIAQYAGKGGKCPDSPEVDMFLREVLQVLLFSGQYGNKRKFCFHAVKGCFTVPYELEHPLEVKIDNNAGTVWNKWFEWYNTTSLSDCVPAADALFEDPNTYPTAYEGPKGGYRVGVLGTCKEDEDAHVIISGTDRTGREIFTKHDGELLSGERLRIENGKLRYTTIDFAKVTGVSKTITKGYVPLYWVNPQSNVKGFLSDYSPIEQNPSYRRFNLTMKCSDVAKVSILGKIRIKEAYAENDHIPFDNLFALRTAAQSVNSHYNNAMDVAQAKEVTLNNIITRENEYKKIQTGTPVKVMKPTSAGRIRNINRGRR